MQLPTRCPGVGQVPRANLVASIADYRARLPAAGFASIDVADATNDCLGGFRVNLARWAQVERLAGRMNLPRSLAAGTICKLLAGFFGLSCKTYLLVAALKPR
jgi:MPBQ/MSBQ methyltransferase